MERRDIVNLVDLLEQSEDVLMESILAHAERNGYTKYTSTLKEAWRLSISGLTSSITAILDQCGTPLELLAEDDLQNHPAAQFGILEARRHRQRGISLSMFFSLLKYYRRSYLDLLDQQNGSVENVAACKEAVNGVFDIIEIGLCVEWAGGGEQKKILEMQISNREMTNEKNKYLTLFESLPTPVFLIAPDGRIDNMNLAASLFLQSDSGAGGQYYGRCLEEVDGEIDGAALSLRGSLAVQLLPWLAVEIEGALNYSMNVEPIEKQVEFDGYSKVFRIKFAQMLDVSKKFSGSILILEDITTLKTALSEVHTLKGLIPICAHCKKMRDDTGYWSKLEEYIEKRSEASFSHSICNECLVKHYDL